MNEQTPLRHDDPKLVAWRAYKQTGDFQNTHCWAMDPEHTVGSLWAAFDHGWDAAAARIQSLQERNAKLEAERDTPEVIDFSKAVQLEAWHQRNRWGAEHDAGKSPFDWFWLIGYLAQKAASAAVACDNEKALHHTISTAAALANWHLALSGGDSSMLPGIEPPAALLKEQEA